MSPSLPPNFIIAPCTPDDINEMVNIYMRSFKTDFMSTHIWPCPPGNAASKETWLRKRYAVFFTHREQHMVKIVDTVNNRIAAVARWTIPYALTAEEKAEREKQDSEKEALIESGDDERWPEGTHGDLLATFFASLDTYKGRLIDLEQTFVLGLLIVDPDYQRMGLGTVLVKHTLERVDREGKKAYLEAMPEGYGMYKKLGWEDVEIMEVDLSSIGVQEPGKIWCMIRPEKETTS